MKFLVTAGPTREPIDPVRYLSNRSSGKMGYAIAEAALDAGHEVILISGPVSLTPPARAKFVSVTTSDEMFNAVHSHANGIDIAVMCAAVCDFKPEKIATKKIKKQDGVPQLKLIPTRDILASLAIFEKNFLVAGFAAETNSLEENARKKLREKNCDVVIGNDVSRMDTGFESDDNELFLFFKNGETRLLPREHKSALAKKLVAVFERMKENR